MPSRFLTIAAAVVLLTSQLLVVGTLEGAETPTATEKTAGANLFGVVQTADGQPLAGALVSIFSAGVRVGTSPYCPTCYADCGKRATSDDIGAFAIERLDPTLVFRVLVIAKGYEPQFIKADPLDGKKITLALKSRAAIPEDKFRIVAGQVIGPHGEPLAGALVEPFGCKSAERRWWGSLPGIDPLAVTDEEGRFELVSEKPIEALDLQVSGRAIATKRFSLVPAGAGTAVNRLEVFDGATIHGRVLDHGRPVNGILVGLVQVNRSAEKFTGPLQIGTDTDGRFLFSNVPSDDDYFVYGIMDSLAQRGAIAARRVHAGTNGEITNAGDLTIEPAYRITGRLALSDGKPVPAHTRVLFSRGDAWDSQKIEADANGTFTVTGIPRGIISITASVPGYRISEKNKSLERLNGFSLEGLMTRDIADLIMLFEPGKRENAHWPASPLEQRALTRSLERLKIESPVGVTADLQPPADSDPAVIEAPPKPRTPLPKIELPPPQPGFADADAVVPKRTVTGHVTDAKGKAIADAEVRLPVRWVSPGNILTSHAKCADDGSFELKFPAEWVPEDVTRIESTLWAFAPGYSVVTENLFSQLRGEHPERPCEMRLQPAIENKFTVLLPDGQPAAEVRVEPYHFLTSRGYEYVPAEIVARSSAKTDREGHATLSAFPREKMLNVRVTSEEFGSQLFQLARQSLDPQCNLTLVPVGSIEGRILAEQPELFRNMKITIETEIGPASDLLNGKGDVLLSVDQEGRFVIPHIAAGWIEIYATFDERLPVRPRLPGRRQIEVVPGKTTRIEIPLEMAVRAHGVIRIKGSGEPVVGATISVGYGTGRQADQVRSDDSGIFQAWVLPGNVRMQVIHIPRGGATQLNDSRSAQNIVPDNVADFELPPIELAKTKSISGRLLNPEGQPLADHSINGVIGNTRYGFGKTDRNGEFKLRDVPEEVNLERFQVWSESAGSPLSPIVETADPLVLRIK